LSEGPARSGETTHVATAASARADLPRPAPAQPGLGAAVRTTSLVTLLSRVFGLVRDMMIVHTFGSTALGSAFAAGFLMPNVFRRLFGEGALSAAFIPQYAKTHQTDPYRADELASYTVYMLALITSIITLIVEVCLLILLFTLPNVTQADQDRLLSIQLIMIMFPFMPAMCVAAILSGMLQVHGRFGASMTGSLFLNLFIICVGAYFMVTGQKGGPWTAYMLGIATVLSGFTQALWFVFLLRPYAKWKRNCSQARPLAKEMLGKFGPVVLGMGGLQISTLLDTLILMWPIWVGSTILGFVYPLDGSSTIIQRSTQLLYQFPLGVFGIAVATAAFPMLARAADQPALFLDTLRRGIRLSVFIGFPASIGLLLVSGDLTRTLFSLGQRGFDPDAVERAKWVLIGYAPAVWAYSLNHVVTRAFYAKGDTWTPMKVTIASILVNFVLNCILIWPLKEAGIAWATSICAIGQTAVMLALAKRRFCPPGVPIFDGATMRAVARTLTAAVVLGAAVGLTQQAWPIQSLARGTTGSWLMGCARLLVCVVAGGGVYIAEALYSRSPELSWLIARPKGAGSSTSSGGGDVGL
jgi:putative peptidoglycan lipid II flippase